MAALTMEDVRARIATEQELLAAVLVHTDSPAKASRITGRMLKLLTAQPTGNGFRERIVESIHRDVTARIGEAADNAFKALSVGARMANWTKRREWKSTYTAGQFFLGDEAVRVARSTAALSHRAGALK